jgi:hypothetical protein
MWEQGSHRQSADTLLVQCSQPRRRQSEQQHISALCMQRRTHWRIIPLAQSGRGRLSGQHARQIGEPRMDHRGQRRQALCSAAFIQHHMRHAACAEKHVMRDMARHVAAQLWPWPQVRCGQRFAVQCVRCMLCGVCVACCAVCASNAVYASHTVRCMRRMLGHVWRMRRCYRTGPRQRRHSSLLRAACVLVLETIFVEYEAQFTLV